MRNIKPEEITQGHGTRENWSPCRRRLRRNRVSRRAEKGTSIYDYIIQVRIEKMMQLLCEGQSVSEAAAELGFSDIKNVSRTFRQLKGITPRNTANSSRPKDGDPPGGPFPISGRPNSQCLPFCLFRRFH